MEEVHVTVQSAYQQLSGRVCVQRPLGGDATQQLKLVVSAVIMVRVIYKTDVQYPVRDTISALLYDLFSEDPQTKPDL